MEQLVNFIIRPPRADYSPKDDLLDDEFTLKGRRFKRKDIEESSILMALYTKKCSTLSYYGFNTPNKLYYIADALYLITRDVYRAEQDEFYQVKNGKGIVLQCSHYVPYHLPEENHLPCVIYCHGNSGCRADASEAAIILLPSNITVFTLDFSGSGLSEGEHVTLGWNEKEDLRAVVDYLRAEGNISLIGLWGRSMGAVTSLLYGVEDPSIAGMVLDSPFSNLVDLMMELVDTYKYPLPKFTVKLAIQHMRRVIKKKANFDIMDLDTIKVAKSSFVPALFGHATDDDFIHPHHSDRIYSSYSGDKNIIKFDGDHNSPRPQFYFDSITIFFHNVLNPPESAFDENFHHTVHDYFGTDNWEAINELEYGHNPIIVPSLEPRASSTEDALTQLRQRRPMSRTDVPPDVTRQDRLLGVEEDPSDSYPRASSSSSPGPSIPTAADDHYLGYQVDCLPDMPSSIEDEERMLMEAILMSLKDSGIMQGEKDEASSVDGRKASTSLTVCNSTSTSEAADLVVESSTNNLSALLDTTVAEKITKSNSLTNKVVQSSMDTGNSTQQTTDNMEGTSARVVVQKNSGGHILDGLAQKWSNLFRNNR